MKVFRAGPRAFPLLSVRMFMPRVCPVGRVGGQVTQPGPTLSLSPSVNLCNDAGHVGTDILSKKCGNPEGQRHRSLVATSHEHHVVAWG
jgi:hypothetical protein